MSLAFEQQLIVVVVLLLATATFAGIEGLARGQNRQALISGMLISAVIVLGATIAGRWLREDQGPFLTMYEILLSNAFSLGLLFVVVSWRVAAVRGATFFVCPVLLLLAAWMLLVPMVAVPLPATFDNYWLWVHVASGKLFLGICLASACAACVLLLVPRAGVDRRAALTEDVAATDRAVWTLFMLAFVFHSLMLLSGSVWAHSAWGRYWSWDPLETWTLVTWLMLGGILHVRATFRNMPEQMGYSLVIAAFVLAFLTFFGMPLVSSAPHKGIM